MTEAAAAAQKKPDWRRGPALFVPEVGEVCHEWVVVGGGQQGGILVRRGHDLHSPVLGQKLQTGAIVEEIELVSGATCRLHYRKVSGEGPDFGWVSVVAGGKELLKLRDRRDDTWQEAPQGVSYKASRPWPGQPQGPAALVQPALALAPSPTSSRAAALAAEAGAAEGHSQEDPQPVDPAGDVEPWTMREHLLYQWSRGAFHPRRTVGEGRPAHPEGQDEPRSGGAFGVSGKQGRVSAVTPTTEGRQHFHETLWACFEAQVWPDKELVVVETYEKRHSSFFANLAKKDKRLVYLKFKVKPSEDWSIGLKRNVCSHVASGEFLAHFDDDDLYAPTYLSTMVGELQRSSALAITLSSWYIFQTRSGVFRHCDPVTWGSLQDEPRGIGDPKVRERAYGYGFSYVYRRSASLDFPYANQNMGEDYAFFSELLRSRGSESVALHPDKYGICLHTQHGLNTSNSFALWEVPRENVHDLEIADFYPVFDNFLLAFPNKEADSDADDGCIKRTPVRRVREVTVHTPARDVRIRCAASATAAELRELLEGQLGALPNAVRLFRMPPSGWVGHEDRRSWAAKVLKVLWPSLPSVGDSWDLDSELRAEWMYLVRRVRNAIPACDRLGARTEELWLSLPDQRGPPGLGSEHGSFRSSPLVHFTCASAPPAGSVSGFFHLDLPLDMRVGDLRRMLHEVLPQGARVSAPKPGKGVVELTDDEALPCRVVVSEFTTPITYELVMTKGQTYELQDLLKVAVSRPEFQWRLDEFEKQDLLKVAVSRPEFQWRLDEFEKQASRDSAQYRTGLAGLLMAEVYPDIQQHFGLEDGFVGQEAMFGALARHGDMRITVVALELETLMRNTKRVAYYKWVLDSMLAKQAEDPAQQDQAPSAMESIQAGYIVTTPSGHFR